MKKQTADGWGSCRRGELTRLAALLAYRRRLWVAGRAGLVLLALTGLGGAGWAVRSALQDDPPAPVPCPGCHDETPEPTSACGAN